MSVRDGVAFPDTLIGTDSHTTMVNGLGVLGGASAGSRRRRRSWGSPRSPSPTSSASASRALPGTATDLVLTLTQMLRAHGSSGGSSSSTARASRRTIADRATLSNMCPEYGATSAFFPVDERTLEYLVHGRGDLTDLVERYT